MISYSAASASRTRSVSCSAPVAIAWTGVVAIRSRPQEGQNLDLPVISLPQREQNMGGSYREATRCARGAGGRSGGRAVGQSRGISKRRKRLPPSTARPPGRPTAWHAPCSISHRSPALIRRDTVVPYHTIAFSQQKLRAALRRSTGQDPAFNYGFVIHSR